MIEELPVVSGLMIGEGLLQGSLKVTLAWRTDVEPSLKTKTPAGGEFPSYKYTSVRVTNLH